MGGGTGRIPRRRRRRDDHPDRHRRLSRCRTRPRPGGVPGRVRGRRRVHRPRHRTSSPRTSPSSGTGPNPTTHQTGAREVAGLLYDVGADVIFHVAGRSGVGVLDAASDLSTNNRWVIGVESRPLAGGDHPTTAAHPDVDRQALRRPDLRNHRGPSRWQPRVRRAPTHRRRRDDHLRRARRCLESRRRRQRGPGHPTTRLGRDPTAPEPNRSAHRAGSPARPGTGAASFGDVPVTFIVPDGWSNTAGP